jgi:hypothetical protein
MTRRRQLRRRLFWAGVLVGVVLLYATVSVLRVWVWSRDAARSIFANGGRATTYTSGRMSRKITIVTGLVAAALAIGVPTALGEGGLTGSPEPDGAAFFANERATLAAEGALRSPPPGYMDAAERALRRAKAKFAQKHSVIRPGADHVLAPPSQPTIAVSASSGSDIEWSQLGVGVGIGIMLATGLWVVLRTTRTGPLTH